VSSRPTREFLRQPPANACHATPQVDDRLTGFLAQLPGNNPIPAAPAPAKRPDPKFLVPLTQYKGATAPAGSCALTEASLQAPLKRDGQCQRVDVIGTAGGGLDADQKASISFENGSLNQTGASNSGASPASGPSSDASGQQAPNLPQSSGAAPTSSQPALSLPTNPPNSSSRASSLLPSALSLLFAAFVSAAADA
jgi:hypothetical protein